MHLEEGARRRRRRKEAKCQIKGKKEEEEEEEEEEEGRYKSARSKGCFRPSSCLSSRAVLPNKDSTTKIPNK